MREINKTIYDILKIVDPNEDISVTQLITDEVVKKSTSGEIKANNREEATGVLDLKALELSRKDDESTSTNIKRQIKASGKTARASTSTTGSRNIVANNPVGMNSKQTSSRVKVKSSGTTTRRVVKVADKSKKNENNNMTKIILVVMLLSIAAYLYLQLN